MYIDDNYTNHSYHRLLYIRAREGIIVSGSIIPPCVGANVTIWYRMSGESWNILAVVITDEYGEYSYDWKYATAGTYDFKAKWDGDASHEPPKAVQTQLQCKNLLYH